MREPAAKSTRSGVQMSGTVPTPVPGGNSTRSPAPGRRRLERLFAEVNDGPDDRWIATETPLTELS